MIIPVFDVKDSVCVSGKSGNRKQYSPLKSVYGNDLLSISHNLKKSAFKMIYIADLDKIEGVGDNSKIIGEVNKIIPVMLDNGCSNYENYEKNKKICTYTILATETMTNTNDILDIIENESKENIILSVDIKDNELLIKNNDIKLDDIISLVNKIKPAYTILLNISEVGTKNSGKNPLNDEIISKTPYTQHIIAGGITNDSIEEYRSNGIDNFLIGTILHDGTLKLG